MNWINPSFEEEVGEFKRITGLFNIPLSSLQLLFPEGTAEELSDESWSQLENTDSWETTTLELVFEAATQVGRDAQSLLEAFQADRPMKMPIVLCLESGKEHLVSGNTRLMVCRALGKRPQVFKLRLKPAMS
jgi:hypothetical protein